LPAIGGAFEDITIIEAERAVLTAQVIQLDDAMSVAAKKGTNTIRDIVIGHDADPPEHAQISP
jgi:hypothetical protein